jgi:hypothetical protein
MLALTLGWSTLGRTGKKKEKDSVFARTDEKRMLRRMRKKEKELKKTNQNQKTFCDLILQLKGT